MRLLVLHLGGENVVAETDDVVVEDAVVGGDPVEVDELRHRPHRPLGGIQLPGLLLDLLPHLVLALPLQQAQRDEERRDVDGRADQLVEHNLLGHHAHAAPGHPSIQHLVPKVTDYAHCHTANGHVSGAGGLEPFDLLAIDLQMLFQHISHAAECQGDAHVGEEQVPAAKRSCMQLAQLLQGSNCDSFTSSSARSGFCC